MCAVRKGIVVNVVDRYEADTTMHKKYTSKVNCVLIEHEDGSYASYSGFKRGEIIVKEGDVVFPYTMLGKLSQYDADKFFDLRLSIYYKEIPIGIGESIRSKLDEDNPLLATINPYFMTTLGIRKIDPNGDHLCSQYDQKVREKEMTRKEVKADRERIAALSLPKEAPKLLPQLLLSN